MENEKKQSVKKVKWETILAAVLILGAAYMIVIGLLVAFSPELAGRVDRSRVVRRTAGVIPYPIALVGNQFITYRKVLSELDSVQRFYESQDFSKIGMRVDFSTDDGKKRLEMKGEGVLNKLIDDAIIQSEAKRVGIDITPDIVNQEVDRKLKEYDTGDSLKNDLDRLYGWNINDFKENIVTPDLYREKMTAYIQANDPSFSAAKEKIDQAASDLKGGMDFSDAAKKYSDGESAQDGGELGWFSADQMLPEVALAVFKLNVGDQSEIIQSSLGYHIVKVEDKKTENDIPMVKVSQIFIKTKSFTDWLKEKEAKYPIFVFSREFYWDKGLQSVRFRSKVMQEYQDKMINSQSDDPSVFF